VSVRETTWCGGTGDGGKEKKHWSHGRTKTSATLEKKLMWQNGILKSPRSKYIKHSARSTARLSRDRYGIMNFRVVLTKGTWIILDLIKKIHFFGRSFTNAHNIINNFQKQNYGIARKKLTTIIFIHTEQRF